MEVQPDGNDKRNAAYMVIIANTYFSMGRQDEGLLALHHSRQIFSSPRNPAMQILTKIRIVNALHKFKERVKLFGVTAMLGVAFGFVESHLQLQWGLVIPVN